MSDLDPILDAIADRLFARMNSKAGPSLNDGSDPLLTCEQAGKRMGVSGEKVRRLVNAGAIRRVKGFKEIRVKQSVVDAYEK